MNLQKALQNNQKLYNNLANSDSPKRRKNYEWAIFIGGLRVQNLLKNPNVTRENLLQIYPEPMLRDIEADMKKRAMTVDQQIEEDVIKDLLDMGYEEVEVLSIETLMDEFDMTREQVLGQQDEMMGNRDMKKVGNRFFEKEN